MYPSLISVVMQLLSETIFQFPAGFMKQEHHRQLQLVAEIAVLIKDVSPHLAQKNKKDIE